MSRQRFIFPSIWTSEQIMSLSRDARLLFVGIISTADDYGRRKATAPTLKVELMPLDDVTLHDVAAWRDELARAGLIRLFRNGDTTILDLPSWTKFQRPKYIAKSLLPEFPGDGKIIPNPDGSYPDVARTPGQSGPEFSETGQDGASGVDGRGGEKCVITTPPCNHPLPGAVLAAACVTNATTGMILQWQERHGDFRAWARLARKIITVDKTDPIGLLAHIVEIDNSKRIKSKPATLLKRLAEPRPGTKRRAPADKWFAKAKEILNGSPDDRKKSEPEQLGDILKGENNDRL